ncbi:MULTISPECIES: hypothetical protein [unclassified Streptomyces]|uniref:hypothetical protein n=1 Tax=unclassified Streptomyces TaxID=2593676 RepID=UPI000823AB57|nr:MULTISPECIES: hypothetical protein [unclassified Streptomyces]MYT96610.1 hypothetical protein [Streptomyces sp. SID8350]SCK54222.1 hypothetical protein YUWDRAFT_04816 [Streptomyces sp. AmelKG-D3]
MSTGSCIARPTETGYTGIYVHFDGYPSGRLPLLLAAYQYRFARDVEAMSVHLIDQVAIAWDELGTDLLDGAPKLLVRKLTGGGRWPSREMENLVTSDGSPPEREVITEANSSSLSWGYVLRPEGIEVISLYAADRGPIVDWNTDPRTRFSDNRYLWLPGHPVPATQPPRPRRAPAVAPKPVPAAAKPAIRR